MKILVVYQSKYGSTRQYAEWIAQKLKADLVHLNDLDPKTLPNYETVIFGTYLHIGKLVDAIFLIQNWEVLKHKQLILFTVSGAKPGLSELTKYYENSVPGYIREKIKYFQFWGRVKNLDFTDSLLIQFPKLAFKIGAMKGKKEDLERLKTFDVDHVSQDFITPLINFVNPA